DGGLVRLGDDRGERRGAPAPGGDELRDGLGGRGGGGEGDQEGGGQESAGSHRSWLRGVDRPVGRGSGGERALLSGEPAVPGEVALRGPAPPRVFTSCRASP